MSREQWGHGYWKGVADAQAGKVIDNFQTEVMFWIANMCCSNEYKFENRGEYPVSEWIGMASFCGLDEKYAKRVYDYILEHNEYEFTPCRKTPCYVSGALKQPWRYDYFIIPIWAYSPDKWYEIMNCLRDKLFRKAEYAKTKEEQNNSNAKIVEAVESGVADALKVIQKGSGEDG